MARDLGDAGYERNPIPNLIPEIKQGTRFLGRKGEYVLAKDLSPTEMDVYYVSGELKGRTVRIRKATHARMMENVQRDVSRRTDRELELWQYHYWPIVDTVKEKGMNKETLLRTLQSRYPQIANDISRIATEEEAQTKGLTI